MTRRLVAILGMIALVSFPCLAMAKSHGGGQGGSKGGMHQPAPNESAYEHAGEKASFQRDTHDMGKHEGQMKQEQEQVKDQDKDKDKDKDKSKGEDQADAKGKQKSKEKSKDKGEGDSAAEMDHGKPEKDQVKNRDKAMEQEHKQLKGDKAKSGTLTEQVKQKGGKAK